MLKAIDSIKNRFLIPFRLIPREGLSPEKLALSITIGIVAGIFPVIGATTIISIMLTFMFRQNMMVVQSVQWIMALVQVMLIIPFMQIGAHILHAGTLQISMHEVNLAFSHGFISGMRILGILHLYAILTWMIIAGPVSLLSYVSLRAVFNLKRNR